MSLQVIKMLVEILLRVQKSKDFVVVPDLDEGVDDSNFIDTEEHDIGAVLAVAQAYHHRINVL